MSKFFFQANQQEPRIESDGHLYLKLAHKQKFSEGKRRCESLGMRLGIYPTDESLDVLNELQTRYDNAEIWVDLVKHSVTGQPMWGGDNGLQASVNDYTTNTVIINGSNQKIDEPYRYIGKYRNLEHKFNFLILGRYKRKGRFDDKEKNEKLEIVCQSIDIEIV